MFLHDAITHGRLMELFDMVEDELVGHNVYAQQEVRAYLTLKYIDLTASFLENCIAYLPAEEICAGEGFVLYLCEAAKAAKFKRHRRPMAQQLQAQTAMYFPRYDEMLTKKYQHVLRTTEDVMQLRFSGVIFLAAATLPGVREDIRCELRRKGLSYKVTLVLDKTLEQRMQAALGVPRLSKPAKQHKLD